MSISSVADIDKVRGLNPCSVGICSVSDGSVGHYQGDCLNPCSVGICSVRTMKDIIKELMASLNPCSVGICSVSVFEEWLDTTPVS